MTDEVRQTNIQVWDVDSILPYEKNAKKHPKTQVAKIAESIRRFGWTSPIIVDRHGVIIAGHGRRLAAIQLGLKKAPVLVRDDLSDEEARALRLADNRVAESQIDADLLREELASLDFDWGPIFDAKELQFSEADLGAMDTESFVSDVSAAVDAQTQEVQRIANESSDKPVPTHKVLGFKTVAGSNQVILSRFMGYVEEKTGLLGGDALAKFASDFVKE